jgi:putative sigma-54 modulation protein
MSTQSNPKLIVSGRHFVITPALETYARKKLSKVEQMFNNITTINIILSVEKHTQKAEAELKLGGDPNPIFAEATTEDMYKSVDALEDKLLRQVKKYHDKLTDHHEGE